MPRPLTTKWGQWIEVLNDGYWRQGSVSSFFNLGTLFLFFFWAKRYACDNVMQNEGTKLTSFKGDPNPKWLHSRSPPHVDALSHYQSTYYCCMFSFVIVSFCDGPYSTTDVLTLISQSAFCIALWVSIAAFFFYYLYIYIYITIIILSNNNIEHYFDFRQFPTPGKRALNSSWIPVIYNWLNFNFVGWVESFTL